MNHKQKILLVHNHYKIPGGEDTVVSNEKRLLEEHGHKVILYSRSNQEMQDFSVWQKLMLPFTSLFSLRTYRDVKALLKKERVDIVHVHNTLNLVSPSVYYAAFSLRVPVVQTLHNFRLLCPAATFVRDGRICEDCVKYGLGCAVRHGCYRNSRLQTLMSAAILKMYRLLGTYRRLFYICLTDFNKEKLLLLNQGGRTIVREERVFVKSNFVWRPQIREVERKEQYLYVGRLEDLKGVRFLVRTWRDFPDRRLLLCGSGPEEAWIRSYISENRMSQIELLGQVSHDEVMRLAAESRALIMPTMCYEGQGLVLLESYAVGTPVLASALGNVGNIVIPNVTGLRFAAGDAEALKEAVRKFEEAKAWDTRPTYEKYYSPEKNYEKLKEIYDRAEEILSREKRI
ncbi:hypothetical protein B5E77_16145 [Lachnoclostridium sp. An131]|uniref:glycosyltransferase family 4 protein n=1 Tax=Lachnoclostridium sp. An131 TaxID=1965555 RepID=UPI000B381E28|nr:glycosyltransferase family 4 protein [Lachnoclostridium sp. An131]OUQ22996.1 hypothetical protein B5E77_16145 [Lachnoclostridium sp. An131]